MEKDPLYIEDLNMHPQVVERLLKAGEKGDIPIQLSVFGRATPTDANGYRLHVTVWQLALLASPIGTCIRL